MKSLMKMFLCFVAALAFPFFGMQAQNPVIKIEPNNGNAQNEINNDNLGTTSVVFDETNSANRNTRGVSLAFYDFESGWPAGFEFIQNSCDCCPWKVGANGAGQLFPIPPHGNYAYVNANGCEGDLSNVWMILPPVDLSGTFAPRIVFDQYSYRIYEYDITSLKVSIDNKQTWTTIPVPAVPVKPPAWGTTTIDLSAFSGESNVYIAFHYNQGATFKFGWAVDNISIETLAGKDLLVSDIFPYGGLPGKTIIPKVVVLNDGQNSESAWSVTLTSNTGYSSTKSGTALGAGQSMTVLMDNWTLTEGQHVLTATVTIESDDVPANNTMIKTINVANYTAEAYIGNTSTETYCTFNISTGVATPIGTMPRAPFPTCDKYNGEYIYRLRFDNTIGYVYPNGVFEPVAKLTGFASGDYGVSFTYDWTNKAWYLIDDKIAFYSVDMNNFTVTKISNSGLPTANTIIAMDMAHNGYIYGPSFNGFLYKIDPVTGIFTQVGPIGIPLNSGQDVSFDFEHLRLYTLSFYDGSRYGFYDIYTGEFRQIKTMNNEQWIPFTIMKQPQPYYQLIMTITDDGGYPVDGAEVTISSTSMPASTVYTTDANGKIIIDFTNGSFKYDIYHFAFPPKSGQFTINNANAIVNEQLIGRPKHSVTFNIKNLVGTNLNAQVSLKYQEDVLHQGTAINGKITFPNVIEYPYTYDVTFNNYKSVKDVALLVDDNKTVNVTLNEIFGLPPAHLDVSVMNSNATLSWVDYGLHPFSYWNPAFDPNGVMAVYQNLNTGFGVIFDLKDYPDAILSDVDFFHWDFFKLNRDFDYIIYIIDVDNKNIIYQTDVLTTTGDKKWEKVKLDYLYDYGGKKVGVFLQGKDIYQSGANQFTNPMLASDNMSPAPVKSCQINLDNLNVTPLGGYIGEYLMTLWISTDEGKKVPVGGRVQQGYEVLLDGVSKGTTTNKSYELSGLNSGTYLAGVRAVYETGTTETIVREFTVNLGIEDTKYVLTYYIDNSGLLTVKADAQTVKLSVYSLLGQYIGNSESNSIRLPKQGVYVVNAWIDGKPMNLKIVW